MIHSDTFYGDDSDYSHNIFSSSGTNTKSELNEKKREDSLDMLFVYDSAQHSLHNDKVLFFFILFLSNYFFLSDAIYLWISDIKMDRIHTQNKSILIESKWIFNVKKKNKKNTEKHKER